jgi:hypothetical protein
MMILKVIKLNRTFREITSNLCYRYSSDEDVLPDELPKQNFIKNGLRSNYYKTTNDTDLKSIRFVFNKTFVQQKQFIFSFTFSNKHRLLRRRRHSSGSLPPFYTGIFQSDEEILSYIDYQLPFDIYWFSQKQGNTITTPSKPINPTKNKKSTESKQKQALPNKRIVRNTSIDPFVQQNLLAASSTNNKKAINKNLIKMEELTEHEKQIVLQSSIFLKRNLRRIKEQKEIKDKNNNQHKQQVDEQSLPLFFSQNYYHSNIINETNCSKENLNLSHKGKYLHTL